MDKKRTRRALSCATCRRLKTRCDYNSLYKKCHRCHVLRLDCSLTLDKSREDVTSRDSIGDIDEASSGLDIRIRNIEDTLVEIKNMVAQSQSSFPSSSSFGSRTGTGTSGVSTRYSRDLDSRNKNAMMTVIRNIDYKLFSRNSSYDHMEEASKPLSAWIKQRPEFCHQMAVIFLQKCRLYVIRKSVGVCSPLLLGVMTLQGMRLDTESTHDDLQKELFDIVRGVLTLALMTTPLRHDDIEALMYISHFNVARKPLQPIYDSWLLTGDAIKLYIMSVSFADMVDRAKSPLKHTAEHDLYLFRLWNSLCHCHLQYSIACGRPVMVPLDYLNECRKIVLLEGSCPSDGVVVSDIELLSILAGVNPDVAQRPLKYNINEWYHNSLPLYSLDMCKCLAVSHYYALLLMETGALDAHKDTHRDTYRHVRDHYGDSYIKPEPMNGINGMGNDASSSVDLPFTPVPTPALALASATGLPKQSPYGPDRSSNIAEYCKSIISIFLDLPPEIIEAMPNYPLCILVYSCITLCDSVKERKVENLALLSKVYWYISHIGPKTRDITHSIAEIIKSVVESSKNIKLDTFNLYPGTTSTTNTTSSTMEQRQGQFQTTIQRATPAPAETINNGMEYAYIRSQSLEAQPGQSQHVPLAPAVQSRSQNRMVELHESVASGSDHRLPSSDKNSGRPMAKLVTGYGMDDSESAFQMPDISKYASYDDFLEKMYSLV